MRAQEREKERAWASECVCSHLAGGPLVVAMPVRAAAAVPRAARDVEHPLLAAHLAGLPLAELPVGPPVPAVDPRGAASERKNER